MASSVSLPSEVLHKMLIDVLVSKLTQPMSEANRSIIREALVLLQGLEPSNYPLAPESTHAEQHHSESTERTRGSVDQEDSEGSSVPDLYSKLNIRLE